MATLVIRPDSVTSSSGFADSGDGLRDKINDYVVNVFDKAHEEPYKNKKPKKTVKAKEEKKETPKKKSKLE